MQWILTVSLVRSGLCSVWVRLPHSRGARIRNQERSCQFPPFLVHLLSPAGAAAKSLQSCLTLCDPIDGSPPGFPVLGTLQARTLERVAISFSDAWKWKVKVKLLSHVQLFATPWTAAYQVPLSMGFSRQEYWSGLPLPSGSNILLSLRPEMEATKRVVN